MASHSGTTGEYADAQELVRDTPWLAEGYTVRSKRVKIELTSDAALVLYDWLTRFNQRTDTDFADQAEERVLFDLESVLEKALVAPLQSDYPALLAQARSNMRDECV